MRSIALLFVASFFVVAGCDRDRSKCLDAKDLDACKAACDKDDRESCKVRDEIWLRQCMNESNMDACKSACDVSKDPKACDRKAGGSGKPTEPAPSGSTATKQIEGGGW